jgi:ribonuclease HI
MNKPHIKSIDIYTDGSLSKIQNSIKCGYGIYFPNSELRNVSAPFTKGEITNNRAELHAIYQAIIRVIKYYTFDKINIYTDSDYAVQSLNQWIIGWKLNDWKTSKNKQVENQDLIKKIDKYLQKYPNKIHIIWIRAHTGRQDAQSINNAIADTLAKKGAAKYISL